MRTVTDRRQLASGREWNREDLPSLFQLAMARKSATGDQARAEMESGWSCWTCAPSVSHGTLRQRVSWSSHLDVLVFHLLHRESIRTARGRETMDLVALLDFRPLLSCPLRTSPPCRQMNRELALRLDPSAQDLTRLESTASRRLPYTSSLTTQLLMRTSPSSKRWLP